MRDELNKTKKELENQSTTASKLTRFAERLSKLFEQVRAQYQPIEQTFTCLSCLEYLQGEQ